ncbi:copper resistance CopC family protein [Kineococcus endophyticus]|uniref:Copper resistance CopC family protein n=1 Tax=Kineococcus endophyticus TaxID=1181883 RepID=A0ABV3P824_9ACTN
MPTTDVPRSTTAAPTRPGPRRALLATAAGVLALTGGLVTAGPAAAHDRLESTNPADGATVATAPDAVVLTMSSTPLALGTLVRVTGPDGAVVSSGDPQIVDADVTEPLTGARPAGTYTVDWRITSSDGHPVSGTFSFTATGAAGGSASPTTSAPDATASDSPSPSTSSSAAVVDPSNPVASEGNGGLIAAGIAVVVVVGGIGGLIGYRRRQR